MTRAIETLGVMACGFLIGFLAVLPTPELGRLLLPMVTP